MAAGLPELPFGDGAWLPTGPTERLLAPMLGDGANLAPALQVLGAPLVAAALARLGRPDPDLAEPALAAAVLNKATRRAAGALIAGLEAEGIATVALKGLATGALLYPHPAYRPLPDVDLLVGAADLARLGAWLAARGWTTRPEHLTVRRWGALTDASFAPVAPPGGSPLVDVHRAIDDAPASQGIPADAVIAAAMPLSHDDGAFRVPATHHVFIILALHAFRDFYEPRGLKGLIDAALLVERHGAALPWAEVERAAKSGRFVRRVVLYRELLRAVGVGPVPVFEGLGSPALTRWAARIADNMRRLDWARLPDRDKVRVEALALDRARDVARLYLRRLAGLIRPRSHTLPGVPIAAID